MKFIDIIATSFGLFFIFLSPAFAKSIDQFSIYDDTYITLSHTFDINEEVYREADDDELSKLNNFEAKYQFSFSLPLFRVTNDISLMASYTQLSLWQFGNSKVSAPFRETNYQPQLFIMHQRDFTFFNNLEYGYMHESNGRGEQISRSWERFYVSIEKLGSHLEYGFQGWLALEVSDNDDIEDYIPPYFVWIKLNKSANRYKAKLFYNFDTDRDGVELSYEHLVNDMVGFYLQIYSGYGETLIDYNHSQIRVSLGVSIQPWE